jgi:hypothetical protein
MRPALLAAVVLVLTACGSVRARSADDAVSAVRAPVPPHAGSRYLYELNDVACASARDCAATGVLYTHSNTAFGLLLTETQGTWTVTEPPRPADLGPGTKSRVAIRSVSCPAVGSCVAVGDASSGAQDEPLVFTQSGSGWRETVLPLPPGGKAGALGPVSCPAAGDCSAAGRYVDAAGFYRALLVSESRGSWGRPITAALPTNALTHADPDFGSDAASIESLSCASPGNCAAVGIYTETDGSPEGLLLTEAGGAWTRGAEAQLPANAAPPSGSYLYPVTGLGSVSCAPTGDCAAVGGYGDRRSDQFGMNLAEHAGRWGNAEVVPVPANAGPNPQQGNVPAPPVWGIVCPAPDACSAIGTYFDHGGNEHGLVLAEHAGSWTPGELILPPDAGGSYPGAVDDLACSSAGNCLAAGSYGVGAGVRLLFATERSGRWEKAVGASLPADADERQGGYSSSVSCPSADTCIAVGSYMDKAGATQGMIATIRRG